MDNLTHSLVGVALAHSSAPWFARLRGPLVAAIVANNLPDIDHAWLDLFEDPRMAYLLHHRGHTHTLALALPQALLAAGAAKLVDAQARWKPLIAVSLIGVVLHFVFDYFNNYGIHPFWPVQNMRYQGDTLFIIDPYLWAILIPAGLSGAGRRLQAAGLLALVAIAVAVSRASSASATAIWAIFAASQAAIWYRPRPAHLAWGIVGGWLAVSALGAAQVRTKLHQGWAARFPGESLLDVSIAPLPARPWCFLAVTISDTGGPVEARTYTLRTGRASLLPALDAAESCVLIDADRTIDLEPVAGSDDRLYWEGQWSRPTRDLQALMDDPTDGCRARQFLQLMRAPFWTDEILGDLRYDFEPGLSFAEISREGPCLAPVSFVSDTLDVLLRPEGQAAPR